MQDGSVSSEEELLRRAVENIRALKAKYGTDIMIVETGVEANSPEEGNKFITALIRAAHDFTGTFEMDGKTYDVTGEFHGYTYLPAKMEIVVNFTSRK